LLTEIYTVEERQRQIESEDCIMID